ncbi:hypothetical protein [Streptomyces dioscori]|nr:hypothetical protein [Streptomyces dioscori]
MCSTGAEVLMDSLTAETGPERIDEAGAEVLDDLRARDHLAEQT